MPKRTDIKSILIIGAGPIVIGQACEFDYSGAQACKALKEEGYRVVLVNSNPATIMTDPGLADATYIEPITPEMVAQIIAQRARPDALLPTMGGQTALNTAMALARSGVLERLRRRADRRQARGDRQGRGPPAVPRGDGPGSASTRPTAALVRSLEEARAALDDGRPAGDHPPVLHPGRHRRRHRLQPRGIRGHRALAASRLADRTRCWSRNRCSAGRNSRWRWCATAPTTASSSARSRTSIRWASTPAIRHRRAGADADRQGIPDHAQRLDRGAARDRRRYRRLERAVRGQSGTTAGWSSSR